MVEASQVPQQCLAVVDEEKWEICLANLSVNQPYHDLPRRHK